MVFVKSIPSEKFINKGFDSKAQALSFKISSFPGETEAKYINRVWNIAKNQIFAQRRRESKARREKTVQKKAEKKEKAKKEDEKKKIFIDIDEMENDERKKIMAEYAADLSKIKKDFYDAIGKYYNYYNHVWGFYEMTGYDYDKKMPFAEDSIKKLDKKYLGMYELNISARIRIVFPSGGGRKKKTNRSVTVSRTVDVAAYRRDLPFKNIVNNQYVYVNHIEGTITGIIIGAVLGYMSGITMYDSFFIDTVIIDQAAKYNKLAYDDVPMMQKNPTKLTEKIEGIDLNISEENCVISYMKKLFSKEGYKYLIPHINRELVPMLALPGKHTGLTCNDIIPFCNKYKIKMMAYKYNPKNLQDKKNIVCKSNVTDTKLPRLNFIVYNNHCYGFQNVQDLKKKKAAKDEGNKGGYKKIKQVVDVQKEFFKLVDAGEMIDSENIIIGMPNKYDNEIKRDDQNKYNKYVERFVYNKTLYTEEDEAKNCRALLKHFCIPEHETLNMGAANILNIILSATDQLNKCKSFFPYPDEFKKVSCVYDCGSHSNKREYVTLDNKKYYGNILIQMKNLYTIDLMTANIAHVDKMHDDYDNYYYVVWPHSPNPCIPDINLYHGSFLNACKNEGIGFTVVQSIECKKRANTWGSIIKSIYKLAEDGKITEDFAKRTVNRFIGCLNQTMNESHIEHYRVFGTYDECRAAWEQANNGFIAEIGKNHAVLYDIEKKINAMTFKPIYNNIIDVARFKMYKLIKDIGMSPEDIIKINIDSITFYIDKLKDFDINKYVSNKMNSGMRDETEKKIEHKICGNKETYCTIFNRFIECDEDNLPDLFKNTIKFKGQRTLYDCVAGCGKSTTVTDIVIPAIKEKWGDDYIVITPCHIARLPYHKQHLINDVIQKYQYSMKVPDASYIIIDEKGLCDRTMNILIVTWAALGKNIFSFGDYGQLLPVEPLNKDLKPYNAPYYLGMLYKDIHRITVNNRNNFTDEYYETLRTSSDVSFLYKQMRKISVKSYMDADYIICNTNQSVDFYNNLKMSQLGYDNFTVGLKLICTTNKYRDDDVYNKHFFTLMTCNDNKCVLVDDMGRELELTRSDYNKAIKNEDFKPAYALTVYCVQSMGIRKIYYFKQSDFPVDLSDTESAAYKKYIAPEMALISGRQAYTVISRLKEDKKEYTPMPFYDVIKTKVKTNNFDEIEWN